MPNVIRCCDQQNLYMTYRSHVFTGANGWEITELLPYGGWSYV